MTCSACDYAEHENPRSYYFRNTCAECYARCLAQSVIYEQRNTEAGKQAYIDALQKLGIADTAKAAHAHVQRWADITSKSRGMRHASDLDTGPSDVQGTR